MATTVERTELMTAEEFAGLPEAPGVLQELVHGRLFEVPGAGGIHGFIVLEIVFFLRGLLGIKEAGVVFGDGVSFVLRRDPDSIRIPDASFIAKERLPGGELPVGFVGGSPDLAVEVVSPNDVAHEVHDKVRQYLAAGTRVVWTFWPQDRTVTITLPDGTARTLGPDDELTTPDFLPAATIRVAALFPPVES